MKKTLYALFCLLFICLQIKAQNNSFTLIGNTLPEVYIETELSAAQVRALAKEYSIDKVSNKEGNLFDVRICLGKKEYAKFENLGIPYTICTPSKANVTMANSYAELSANWNRYPTYSAYLEAMQTFQSQYPNLCKIDTILAQTPNGHALLAAHISNDLTTRGDKPAFFYTSTMHGDEPVGYYLMLHLIHHLLTNYDSDDEITNLINNIDIWICPLENPDGTYHSSDNSLNESPHSTRYNANGEDLNRSYPIVGQGGSGNCEPEVQAMIDFCADKHFTMSANFHGGSEVFNYPWDTWESWQHSHADEDWWEWVGHRFANSCQQVLASYFTDENNGITQGAAWYSITGSRQDYFNYYQNCREVTIEVSSNKVVSSSRLPNYWDRTRSALLGYMGQCLNGFRGIVTDSITGMPLAATVTIANHDCDNSEVHSLLPTGNYHRPIKSGDYIVTYSAPGYRAKAILVSTNDNSCVRQDVQLVPNNYTVADYSQPVFMLYPNPTDGILVITSMVHPPKQFDFYIYDQQGRKIYYSKVDPGTSTLDISPLRSGTYIAQIYDGNKLVFSEKIVKL